MCREILEEWNIKRKIEKYVEILKNEMTTEKFKRTKCVEILKRIDGEEIFF